MGMYEEAGKDQRKVLEQRIRRLSHEAGSDPTEQQAAELEELTVLLCDLEIRGRLPKLPAEFKAGAATELLDDFIQADFQSPDFREAEESFLILSSRNQQFIMDELSQRDPAKALLLELNRFCIDGGGLLSEASLFRALTRFGELLKHNAPNAFHDPDDRLDFAKKVRVKLSLLLTKDAEAVLYLVPSLTKLDPYVKNMLQRQINEQVELLAKGPSGEAFINAVKEAQAQDRESSWLSSLYASIAPDRALETFRERSFKLTNAETLALSEIESPEIFHYLSSFLEEGKLSEPDRTLKLLALAQYCERFEPRLSDRKVDTLLRVCKGSVRTEPMLFGAGVGFIIGGMLGAVALPQYQMGVAFVLSMAGLLRSEMYKSYPFNWPHSSECQAAAKIIARSRNRTGLRELKRMQKANSAESSVFLPDLIRHKEELDERRPAPVTLRGLINRICFWRRLS